MAPYGFTLEALFMQFDVHPYQYGISFKERSPCPLTVQGTQNTILPNQGAKKVCAWTRYFYPKCTNTVVHTFRAQRKDDLAKGSALLWWLGRHLLPSQRSRLPKLRVHGLHGPYVQDIIETVARYRSPETASPLFWETNTHTHRMLV